MLALLLALFSPALPAQAAEGKSEHITARLIAESAAVAPGGAITLAFDYTTAKGWHTYWINPGDTGLPTKFDWNLPDGFSIDEVRWPTPELLPSFGLMSYGYDSEVTAIISARNESKLTAGETLPIRAHVSFLVCADICIPESLDVSLDLKVGEGKPGPDAGLVAKAQAALPKASDPQRYGTIDVNNGTVELGFPASAVAPQGAYFFPAQGGVLDAVAPQAVDMGAKGFTIRVKTSAAALPDGPLSGVLKLSDGTAYIVDLTRGPPPAGAYGLGAPAAKGNAQPTGLLIAMLFAFTGGLILNLMPCVFPVLSMKLLSLARSGGNKAEAQLESLFYGAGTILTFVGLALILMAARALGQSIGWGFQLQSPYVTAFLSVVMLLVALNMSGVFEIGSSLQAAGGLQVSAKRPRLGAFLTGVLAVVVAAPCTAPFMATAIGAALAQGGLTAFAIFVALGIGFALPFVLLTFLITLVPAVARALPKPGKWMDVLKHILSVPMYLACLWLVWVFTRQVRFSGTILLVFALVLVGLAVMKIRVPKFVKPVVLAGALALCGLAATLPAPDRRSADIGEAGAAENPLTDFNPARLAEFRAANEPVLVDMTAAWCVTCKVNEARVFNTKDVAAAFRETRTHYMVGDWTSQDAEISRYLAGFGRSGVPLYVYYGPNNAEPVVLPQLLDKAAVLKLIRQK